MKYFLNIIALTLAIILIVPICSILIGVSAYDIWLAIQDKDILFSIAMSISSAFIAVILGLLLGVPTGYLLAKKRFWWTHLLETLIDLPLAIPHPILGIGLLFAFAPQNLIGGLLKENWNIEFISSIPAIVLAMFIVSVPFIVRSSKNSFRTIPKNYNYIAKNLGANDWQIFFTISLPLAFHGIRAGSIMAWARSISEFGSIIIIAYYPKTAPVLIWDRFSVLGLKAALPPTVLLLLICLFIFTLLQYFQFKKFDNIYD